MCISPNNIEENNKANTLPYGRVKSIRAFLKNNSSKIEKYCKNNMAPMEDYEMKIYAEGKLVTLERKSNTKEFNNKSPLNIKGWGALIRKGEKSGAEDFRVLLYLPQGSDEFVIIRK